MFNSYEMQLYSVVPVFLHSAENKLSLTARRKLFPGQDVHKGTQSSETELYAARYQAINSTLDSSRRAVSPFP
jgi:hypothetical protein